VLLTSKFLPFPVSFNSLPFGLRFALSSNFFLLGLRIYLHNSSSINDICTVIEDFEAFYQHQSLCLNDANCVLIVWPLITDKLDHDFHFANFNFIPIVHHYFLSTLCAFLSTFLSFFSSTRNSSGFPSRNLFKYLYSLANF